MGKCKVQTCGRADCQQVTRGPKFADHKCGRVGKMRTIILRTKNCEITISTRH